MKNYAQLRHDSVWFPLFDGGAVPIRNIRNILVPHVGEMIGDGVQEYFEVDVGKLTPEQIRRIAIAVAAQCGGQAEEVEQDMLSRGFIPLRAKHVSSVRTDSLAFL